MPLLIIIQSLLLPLLFSATVYYLSSTKKRTQALLVLLAWITIYFWTKGELNLIPGEALDWIWMLIAISTIFILLVPQQWIALLHSILFGVFVIIFSWPILSYQNDLTIWFELIFFEAVIAITFFRIQTKPEYFPALLLTSSSFALALVSIFSGSLLLGQLALSLAALIAVFSFYEIIYTPTKYFLLKSTQLMISSLYFSLVVIGRLYVEVPIVSTVLLVLSPLSGIFFTQKKYCLLQVALGGGAILWVFV